MDELDLLKKDWQKQEGNLPKLSYKEIYKMTLKRSSSIVKWIFAISIIEFVLWASIDLWFKLSGKHEQVEIIGMEGFSIITGIISYGILLYFIYRFYIDYKKIQSTDSAKVLMKNILRARKTVKYYVLTNLSVWAGLLLSTMIYMLFFTDQFSAHSSDGKELPIIAVLLIFVVFTAVVVGLLALVYRLVYGILTKRLKNNYKELEKLEV